MLPSKIFFSNICPFHKDMANSIYFKIYHQLTNSIKDDIWVGPVWFSSRRKVVNSRREIHLPNFYFYSIKSFTASFTGHYNVSSVKIMIVMRQISILLLNS